MYLLKKGALEFGHILSGGYEVTEGEQKVAKEVIMADGSIRRNYYPMPKTEIKVTFGHLTKTLMAQYLTALVDGQYTYWSPLGNTTATKYFYVKKPSVNVIYSESTGEYDDFTVVLEQYDE